MPGWRVLIAMVVISVFEQPGMAEDPGAAGCRARAATDTRLQRQVRLDRQATPLPCVKPQNFATYLQKLLSQGRPLQSQRGSNEHQGC